MTETDRCVSTRRRLKCQCPRPEEKEDRRQNNIMTNNARLAWLIVEVRNTGYPTRSKLWSGASLAERGGAVLGRRVLKPHVVGEAALTFALRHLSW